MHRGWFGLLLCPIAVRAASLPDAAWPVAPVPPAVEVTASDDAVVLRWDRYGMTVTTVLRGGPVVRVRTSRPLATHVEVHDTFTNPGAGVVGLRVRHAVADRMGRGRLGGRDATGPLYDPWNPTVFAPVAGGGVGLVAEDDVFRNQLFVDRDPSDGTLGLRTDMLCLAPGTSQTIVWSVYPVASGDYWDFVNVVRRDWGVNRTVPGAFLWFRPDDVLRRPADELRVALQRQGVRIASLNGGWVDPSDATAPPRIGFGTHVLDPPFDAYRARIRRAVAALRAAAPDLTVLLYFDAQRESVPDAPTRFADSLLAGPSGRPERADFGGRFSPSWSMVPTATNRFGRALPGLAAAMRGLGADGLYWDEMDAVEYEQPRLTTAVWDGYTCRLDQDGHVLAKLGLANLLADDVKQRAAGTLRVLGNSPPTTRAFQARGDLRMIEAQHNDVWGAYAHLTTPLGYLGGWTDWARVRAKIDEGLLVAGGSLDAPSAMVARMFPFTPDDLRPGVLHGHERIVTTRSGPHGWADGAAAVRAYRYDADGKEHPADWPTERQGDGVLVRVTLAAGEAAVIERDLPAAAPACTAWSAGYGAPR